VVLAFLVAVALVPLMAIILFFLPSLATVVEAAAAGLQQGILGDLVAVLEIGQQFLEVRVLLGKAMLVVIAEVVTLVMLEAVVVALGVQGRLAAMAMLGEVMVE
jgi:hypothetical protein